jgi:hypothetical protein
MQAIWLLLTAGLAEYSNMLLINMLPDASNARIKKNRNNYRGLQTEVYLNLSENIKFKPFLLAKNTKTI